MPTFYFRQGIFFCFGMWDHMLFCQEIWINEKGCNILLQCNTINGTKCYSDKVTYQKNAKNGSYCSTVVTISSHNYFFLISQYFRQYFSLEMCHFVPHFSLIFFGNNTSYIRQILSGIEIYFLLLDMRDHFLLKKHHTRVDIYVEWHDNIKEGYI